MGPTETLAQFVVNTRLRDIPTKAIEISKLVILDLLGVTLAASRQAGAKIITEYLREVRRRAQSGNHRQRFAHRRFARGLGQWHPGFSFGF